MRAHCLIRTRINWRALTYTTNDREGKDDDGEDKNANNETGVTSYIGRGHVRAGKVESKDAALYPTNTILLKLLCNLAENKKNRK